MQYKIIGKPMPVVVCNLEPGESMVTQKGSMVWMTSNMEMRTSAGGLRKMLSRIFSGESVFQNIYTAKDREGSVTFGLNFPGSIRAVEISPNHPIIVQKSAFLAATSNVKISVYFQKKIKTGVFGGEGFIMQKISGSGTVFLEIDGSSVEYYLNKGEQYVVSTGYLAMMDRSCRLDVRRIRGVNYPRLKSRASE